MELGILKTMLYPQNSRLRIMGKHPSFFRQSLLEVKTKTNFFLTWSQKEAARWKSVTNHYFIIHAELSLKNFLKLFLNYAIFLLKNGNQFLEENHTSASINHPKAQELSYLLAKCLIIWQSSKKLISNTFCLIK